MLDSLHIHIGPVPLGVLVIDDLDIDYSSGQTWRGSGKLSVPAGGSLAANFRFDAGEFGGAGFDYTLPPPATIGPFVYLLSVGGDFFLRPETKIAARASIGAGAAVQGQAPVKVNGQFTMAFPRNGPGAVQPERATSRSSSSRSPTGTWSSIPAAMRGSTGTRASTSVRSPVAST